MLGIYHFLTTLAIIFGFPLFSVLENGGRLKERLALSLPRLKMPTRRRIWVHALSVGEVLSAIPVLEALKTKYPSREVVLSVKTTTGLQVAGEKLKDTVDLLVPMPLDFWWSIKRLIGTIMPAVFILVETDIWPGLVSMLKKSGVRAFLVNGRVSPHTGKAYARWRFLVRTVLNQFELMLMQTELDESRILKTGVSRDKVRVSGNIKFDQKWEPLDSQELQRWHELLGVKEGLIWVAGSTHDPEETIIFNVFEKLIEVFTNLSLIICPRETSRFGEVASLAQHRGFNAIRRTRLPSQGETYNVFVLDTIGELSKVYSAADVAFVGGSLTPFGGHNLLEPASFGIPVVFGPYTFNFDAMSRSLVACGGGKRVVDESDLLSVMRELLGREDLRRQIGERAQAFVEGNQGALEKVMAVLEPYINS
jgi:3-deoxy-D-manno-octulosonic-acid transferase